QVEGVRGGAAEEGGVQIDHELNLTVGVARRGRDGQTADLVRTAIQSGTAREQAVTVADLHHVVLVSARRHDGAGAAFFPEIQVFLGIEGNHAFAGRAGSGLNAHAIGEGESQKSVRVRLPQVVFGEE